jgi:serine phosphatase RsbU (regulator of sigma subunit)/rubredoxin
VIQERKLLKRITAELLARNPSWCVIVGKRDWLCPFCGEIGAEGLRMDDSLELLILQHLATGCDGFTGPDAQTLAPAELQRRAAVLALKRRVGRRVERDPVWQVRDRKGAWICPFCARPTDVALELPDERGPGAEADGVVREHDLRRIVRHLLSCEPYQQGKGDPRPLVELLSERERADRQRLRKRLERRLTEQPAFRFRDMEHHWLCPFCAETTQIEFDRRNAPTPEVCDAVWQHLEGCAAHQQSEGKPRTERFLKDRVIAINKALVLRKLERKLSRRTIWQVTDAEDNWLCPYCGSFTDVKLPAPRRHSVSQAALNGAWLHLSSCPQYAGKRARLRQKSELRSIVEQQNRYIRLRREVARALVEDERWSVRDDFGSWLCPYCRKVQKSISISRDGTPLRKTLLQVVTHVMEQCPRYTEGAEPEIGRLELEALVRPAPVEPVASPAGGGVGPEGGGDGAGPASTSPSGRHAPAPEGAGRRESAPAPAGGPAGSTSASGRHAAAPPEDWLRRIDAEVAALKSHVELSLEMERSLEQARSRQLRLLPSVPEVEGFEFGVIYRPCSRVGGDFYDFVHVSDAELGVAVGDISGHGLEAALLVGLAKKLLEVHGRGRSSPGHALVLGNADIYPDLDARTFVTVLYGVLHKGTGRFRFARAGHNPLVLFNAARTPRLHVLDCKGMALGMVEGQDFHRSLEEVEIQLAPGDLLFLYTDGVTEAMNHDGEEFGAARLHEVITRYGEEEAEYVLYQVEKAIHDFREGARQHDDITMVAIKVRA